MRWRTLIENWEPGKKFVDRQLKGPYQLWHHTHEFEEFAGGTLMRDRVLYKVPFGRLGAIVSGAFVRSDVTKIFNYRKKVISDLFN
jgi:ligand-binding SRPBCC domain-containing protein